MRYTFLLSLIIVLAGGCKKVSLDPCIEKFVGVYSGSVNATSSLGSCSSGSFTINIQPGTQQCEVLLPDLPSGCYSSSYQVLGTISGDSIWINTQPFGNNTVSGQGRLYLNQLSFVIQQSDSTESVMALTRQ